MKNLTLAAVDLGTNTFRLLIADVFRKCGSSNYTIKEIHSERVITRLGEGVSEEGVMKDEPMLRSINTLRDFSKLISLHKVSQSSVIATSVLREAGNSDEFLDQAFKSAGLAINVITGAREAELTAKGMLLDIPAPDTALMLDIGGGSTELILMSSGKPVITESLSLGVVHLADKYMTTDPPSTEELFMMKNEIAFTITSKLDKFKKYIARDTQFFGTAGTVTALSAIKQNLSEFSHHRIHKTVLDLNTVDEIFSEISSLTSSERSRLIPFELSRLDIIVPGTLILSQLMKMFSIASITVSNYGLREGILIDLYNNLSERCYDR